MSDRCYLVAFVQADELDPLCVPACFADVSYRHPDGDAGFTGDHQVLVLVHIQDADQRSRFVSYIDGFHPFPAPVGNAVFVYGGTFSEAFVGYDQDISGRVIFIDTNHANDFIALIINLYASYSDSAPARSADLVFRESDSPAAAEGHHYFRVAVREPGFQ